MFVVIIIIIIIIIIITIIINELSLNFLFYENSRRQNFSIYRAGMPRVIFYKILWFDDRGLSLMTNIFYIYIFGYVGAVLNSSFVDNEPSLFLVVNDAVEFPQHSVQKAKTYL